MEEGGRPGGTAAKGAGAKAEVETEGGPEFSTCASRRPSNSLVSLSVTRPTCERPASQRHSVIQSRQSCGRCLAWVPRRGGGEQGRAGEEEGGEGEAGGGERLTPKIEGGREGLGLEGATGTTVRSDGAGETPGEEEAYPEVTLNPSPAGSSKEGTPFPGTRPGLRGLGGSGCDGATGGGASTAMALTG